MSRVQIPDQGEASLRPAASPVNRFAAPEQQVREEGATQAMQISSALSDLVPELIKFSAHRDQRQNEEAVLSARATRAQNAVTFRDAVKSGKISADQNPWFIKTWKEMDGNVAADRYHEDLLLAMSQGELANSTSHDDSSKMLDNFRSNWVKENLQNQDPDVVTGFGTRAAGYELSIREAQASRVGNNIIAAAAEAFDQSIQGRMLKAHALGENGEDVATFINRESDKLGLAGVSPQDRNQMILKAVAADAEESLDVDHGQQILNNITTGPGGKLGGTTAAKALMQQVESNVANRLYQIDNHAYTQRERQNQEIIQNASSTVGQALLQSNIDHKPVMLEDFKTQIDAMYKAGGREAAEHLTSMILKSQSDPESEAILIKDKLYVDVLGAKGMIDFDKINQARANGEISLKSWTFLAEKMNEHIRQNKADAKEPSFWKNPAYVKGEDALRRLMLGDEKTFTAAQAELFLQASGVYWNNVYKWDVAHPNAMPNEHNEYARQEAQQQFENFRNEDMKGLVGPLSNLVNDSQGVKSGRTKGIGMDISLDSGPTTQSKIPPADEPAFKSTQLFHEALMATEKDPLGSPLAIMAKQHGMTLAEFIDIQTPLYRDDAPAKK